MEWTPPPDFITVCQGGVEFHPPEGGDWNGRLPPLVSDEGEGLGGPSRADSVNVV